MELQVLLARMELHVGPVQLAAELALPASTIGAVLRRWQVPHLADLDRITGELLRSRATEQRYEHPRPGDLLHVDVKKLGRIPDAGGWRIDGANTNDHQRSKHVQTGFDYVHVAIDDHSRVAYAEVLADERATTCAGFLHRATSWFHDTHGVTVRRVLAADLSLPKLQARWAAAGGSTAPTGGPSAPAQDRAQLWAQASQAAADAAEQVRGRADSSDAEGLADAGDAAAAAAEVLSAASRLIEGDAGWPLTQAARDYDRAAREVRGRLPEATLAGTILRTAALQLARSGKAGRNEATQIALLVAQIGSLSLSVGRLREAQGRTAQAAAARHATPQRGRRTPRSSGSARRAARSPNRRVSRPRRPVRQAARRPPPGVRRDQLRDPAEAGDRAGGASAPTPSLGLSLDPSSGTVDLVARPRPAPAGWRSCAAWSPAA